MNRIPDLPKGAPDWLHTAWNRAKILAEDPKAQVSCEGFQADELALSTSKSPVPAPKDLIGSPCYYRFRELDFKRRHPDQAPPQYYRDFGEKYALKFTNDLMPELSPQGVQFVKRARRELQLAIEGQLVKDPQAFDRLEQDGDALKKFAYGTHAQAYLRGGIADLSLWEKFKVARVPDAKDMWTKDGLKQAAEVAVGVVKVGAARALRTPIITGPVLLFH